MIVESNNSMIKVGHLNSSGEKLTQDIMSHVSESEMAMTQLSMVFKNQRY